MNSLSSIPSSSRYFSSQLGMVLWEVTEDSLVFPINVILKTRGPRSKLRLGDFVTNPHVTEITPEAAAEVIGVPLETDASAPSSPRSSLCYTYTAGFGEVVTLLCMSDRFDSADFPMARNHFFSMS